MKKYIAFIVGVLVAGAVSIAMASSYYASASTTATTVHTGKVLVTGFVANNNDTQDVTYIVYEDTVAKFKFTADANTTTMIDLTDFGGLFLGTGGSTTTFKVTGSTTPTSTSSVHHWTAFYNAK